jgi:integrase
MGRKLPGIYQHDDGRWWVDKVVAGRRLQKAFGADYAEAQDWLLQQLTRIRAAREGERPRFTFEEASCRYLQEHHNKPSLEDEILYLKLAMPYVGALLLDEICDETLEPLVSALKAPVVTKRNDGTETVRVRKNKTVNLVLGTIRQVLNLAARKWRVEGNRRLTWLIQAPLITMLDLHDARSPKPITWAQQRVLLPHLSVHSAQMALFVLNTGARDATVCSLRWEWEVRSPELRYSIFVVPKNAVINARGKVRGAVKGRKRDRVLVLNRVAQSVVEARRGKQATHVFAFRGHPVQSMSNTAWQNGRREAGKEDSYLTDLRVHDLRHTVGMRLREMNVRENTIADILWHEHSSMTRHYSVAQIDELVAALDLVADENGKVNKTLQMLQLAARKQAVV